MTSPKICQITPKEYQDEIVKISKHYPTFGTDKALPTYSAGLSEEVGEVMGIIKRHFRGDAKPENFKENLTKELVVCQGKFARLNLDINAAFFDVHPWF
ncbi:hypothetical protein WKK05_40160 (plasmid) [Nostoc sp. UHCC 0302]|uniref:hypothetical protein n=1 Tax=Nostoc sp. UHCC 0302 TaxID=3134896 RepID=UPI00311C920A